MAPRYSKEPAIRMFPIELKETHKETSQSNGGQYEIKYILPPTGSKVNRVLIAGPVTAIDKMDSNREGYRMRISGITESTGSVPITAMEEFQPDAYEAISKIEAPAFVVAIAKPSLFQPQDAEEPLVTLRAESVRVLDDLKSLKWFIQETAKATTERLDENEVDPDVKKRYEDIVADVLEEIGDE
jgi:RPA family protein